MTPQIYQHILAQIDQATHDCKMENTEARVFLEDLIKEVEVFLEDRIEDVEARLAPLVMRKMIEDSRLDDCLGFAGSLTQPEVPFDYSEDFAR